MKFSQVTSLKGFTSDRVFKKVDDQTIEMVIEGANPGEQPHQLLDVHFKKQT